MYCTIYSPTAPLRIVSSFATNQDGLNLKLVFMDLLGQKFVYLLLSENRGPFCHYFLTFFPKILVSFKISKKKTKKKKRILKPIKPGIR